MIAQSNSIDVAAVNSCCCYSLSSATKLLDSKHDSVMVSKI